MRPEAAVKVYQLILEMELTLDARLRPPPGEADNQPSTPPTPAAQPQPMVH